MIRRRASSVEHRPPCRRRSCQAGGSLLVPRRLLPLPLALAVLAGAPAAAPAAFSIATQSNPSFGLTKNGTDQTGVSSLVVRVTQTDTGANGKTGWNVTLTSTPFQTTGGSQLGSNATTWTSGSTACAQAPCTNPSNMIAPPVAVPAASPAPAAVKVYNAMQNTGTGVFDLTGSLQTTVLANADAGAYSSTLTISLVRGP